MAILGFVFLVLIILGIRSALDYFKNFGSKSSIGYRGNEDYQDDNERRYRAKCRWCGRRHEPDKAFWILNTYYHGYCSPKCYNEHKKR